MGVDSSFARLTARYLAQPRHDAVKYGILFLICGVLLAWFAVSSAGFRLAFLWPALNFVLVGCTYVVRSPRIFGKQSTGRIGWFSITLLLPFFVYLWFIWHLARCLTRENKYDSIDEKLLIGRRLLGSEMIDAVDNVVDLTCEFSEPFAIRSSVNYISFPILDASVPAMSRLRELVERIDSFDGTTYIHCAQGHGRTGLVAAALLMHRNPDLSPTDTLNQLQAVRPALACNRSQIEMLCMIHASG